MNYYLYIYITKKERKRRIIDNNLIINDLTNN